MRRSLILLALALILILAVSTAVFAFNGPPNEDSWVDASDSNHNGTADLKTSASGSAAGCTPSFYTYLKYDISSILTEPVANKTVGTAILDMTADFVSVPSDITATLYAVDDDTWTETAITGNNAPVLGAALTSVVIPASVAVGDHIVFPTSVAFADWLNDQSSATPGGTDDNVVSFAVQITNCGNGSFRIDFEDKTRTDPPILDLLNPNTVTLSSLSADNTQSVNWALYVGLAGLAVLVLGAVGYGYSRTR